MIFLFFLGTQGCSVLQTSPDKKRNSGQSEAVEKEEENLEAEPKIPVSPGIAKALVGQNDRPDKTILVLGPGGAKAFAQVGFLKEAKKQGLKFDQVIGLEFGALIGGLYAMKGLPHDVEWKLSKIDFQALYKKGFFSSKADIPKPLAIRPELRKAFGKVQVDRGKISFSCPAMDLKNGRRNWLTIGRTSSVVERCLSGPPLFQASQGWYSDPSLISQRIHGERASKNLVVFVSVVDELSELSAGLSSSERALWSIYLSEVGRSGGRIEWVRLSTKKTPWLGFNQRKQLVRSGQANSQAPIRRILRKHFF